MTIKIFPNFISQRRGGAEDAKFAFDSSSLIQIYFFHNRDHDGKTLFPQITTLRPLRLCASARGLIVNIYMLQSTSYIFCGKI